MTIRRPARRGNAAVVAVVMLLLIVVLLAMVAWLIVPFDTQTQVIVVGTAPSIQPAPSADPLLVYCAASNKAVVEKIAAAYREETGVAIEMQFGPSQTLLAQMEISGHGDLYLPADDSYIAQAREKGLAGETFTLGKMQGVLLVAAGNPKKILAFDDLLRKDVRVSQANPGAAAIGSMTREVLLKTNLWDKLAERSSFKSAVTDAANDVKIGAADVAIVWDVVAKQYTDSEQVALPELEPVVATTAVAVVPASKQPEEALKFARYLADKDKGQTFYREAGFAPAPAPKTP